MEWWPFLIFHRGGLRIKVINNSSSFNNFISFLTWQSVTIHSPFNSGVWIIFRPPEKPGILIVVRREF